MSGNSSRKVKYKTNVPKIIINTKTKASLKNFLTENTTFPLYVNKTPRYG
jgi:hypothetical protein